ACVGIVAAATILPSRPTVWLMAAIALQAAALFVVATRSGADRPYLALKMVYLAIYPMAVAASLLLGWMGGMGWTGGMGGRMVGETRPSSLPSSLSRLSSLSR